MADFSGNHPRDWLPPPGQVAPGAMWGVFSGNATIRAVVARDPAEMKTYVPKASYFLNWHGLDEAFEKGVARLVSVELFDYLTALESSGTRSIPTRPSPSGTATSGA